MKEWIEKIGPESVLLVVIDGGSDWSTTKDMIQSFFPWISFMHCTSHETSLIVKDCFDEDDGIPELVKLNKIVTDAQHWFSTHACKAFLTQQSHAGEKTTFVWPALTRYCGLLLKFKRFCDLKVLLRRVVQSGVYVEKNFANDIIAPMILGAEVWQTMEKVIKMLGPILLLCRLADGQKPVISKLYGTQLYVRKQMELTAAETDDDSVENQILAVFLRRWPEMQCEIVSATYLLDPLFVPKSRESAECTICLWRLARKVLRIENDDQWIRMHGVLVRQLTKFQSKGGNLSHMSSPAAWVNLHSQCALEWWSSWGQEVPELQQLAMKIVPLLIGSGPAERTWKDVGQIFTKNRNRLGVGTCLDLVFVRTWLRRQFKSVTAEELEVLKDWEADLLRKAAFYDGPVEPAGPAQSEQTIFEDSIEDWEQWAIDGNKYGGKDDPKRLLGDVRRDGANKFRLQEKYKGLYLVDKDPDEDTVHYTSTDNTQVEPVAPALWEHRKIIGLCWQNREGWYVETKLCNDMSGESSNYQINASLLRMIRESNRNRSVQMRSRTSVDECA